MNGFNVGIITATFSDAGGYLSALLRRADVSSVSVSAIPPEGAGVRSLDTGKVRYGLDPRHIWESEHDLIFICPEFYFQIPSEGTDEAAIGWLSGRSNAVEAFPFRTLSSVIETKKAIARGDIGEIMAVKAFHRSWEAAWRSEKVLGYGGAFQDAVHMADALVWMIRSPIVEVYAETGCVSAAEAGSSPDAVFLHAAFANGATATIDLSRSSPLISPVGREFRLELVGTEGNLTMDAFRQRNESSGGIHSTRAYWGDDLHATFVDAAIASTRTDGYDFRPGDRRVYEAVAAAQESARIGKPVRLGSPFRNSRGETP